MRRDLLLGLLLRLSVDFLREMNDSLVGVHRKNRASLNCCESTHRLSGDLLGEDGSLHTSLDLQRADDLLVLPADFVAQAAQVAPLQELKRLQSCS